MSDLNQSFVFNNGNVGIGTTSPSYPLHVSLAADGDVAGFTDTNGTCTINPTSTALICTSDRTKKKNILTLDNSLDIVTALRGVTFNWLGESTGDTTHIGFIAQEVEQLVPSLVSTNSQGVKSVNYLGFAPLLANAIGEQQLQIGTLDEVQNSQSSSLSVLLDQIAQILADIASLTTRVTNLEQAQLGALQAWQWVNGEYHSITRAFFDKTPVLADEDSAGYILVKSGASEVVVTFAHPLPYQPIVSVTPLGSTGGYYLSDVSLTSFTLKLNEAATQDTRFSWSIVLSSDTKTTESQETAPPESGGAPPSATTTPSTPSPAPTSTGDVTPNPTVTPTGSTTPTASPSGQVQPATDSVSPTPTVLVPNADQAPATASAAQ